VLLGILIMANWLIHLAIRLPSPKVDAPMQTAHSWLLGDVRALSLVLAVVCGLVLIAGGVGYLTSAAWWPVVVIAGAAVSAVLMAVTFTPWWLAALAIDVARGRPPGGGPHLSA